jgi:endonuclease/exonuclease/phosphatase family metal-dependent hydrolase
MEDPAAAFAEERPAHAAGPIVVNRPARGEQQLLKVVAFNAQGGGSLKEIVERLRRPPLNRPDVILLSEMDWRMRRSGGRETAAELAAELALSFAYVGEFGMRRAAGEPGSFIGNAILSSRPLTEVRALPMPRMFSGRRVRRMFGTPAGLAATIVVNRRPISLGIAHLNSRWNPAGRALQMTQYLEAFPSDGAAIIGGDFNTTTWDLRSPAALIKVAALSLIGFRRFRYPQKWEPLFERLRQIGFETRGANLCGRPTFTPSGFIPSFVRPKLDWLALRQLRPVIGSAAVVPARRAPWRRRFSDHDFIMCLVQT